MTGAVGNAHKCEHRPVLASELLAMCPGFQVQEAERRRCLASGQHPPVLQLAQAPHQGEEEPVTVT